MSDALKILPIFVFMLTPLFLPLIGVIVGTVVDLIKAPARLAATSATQGAHAARPAPATVNA